MNAIDFFAAKLDHETDPSDVAAAMAAGQEGLLVIDSRSEAAWKQGHVRGALHLPTAEIVSRSGALVPLESNVVVYCWGPGCNGATRASLEFARLGYAVREMIGGYEYWVREGFPIEGATAGASESAPDRLTTIVDDCGC